jgi:CRISPR/Cas system-associated endonuclease Cas3-HD
VGVLEFEVFEKSIFVAREMHDCGEKWFKSMSLNFSFSKGFLKLEYQGDNLSKGVPRSHMLEYFEKILRIIQRYFTCEGRFNMLYQYHIRLLLQFTGKESMNLPFHIFRSIGKMLDKVQAMSKQVDTSVFHSGLIKMLVLEELKKTNNNWEVFLVASSFHPDIAHTP